MPSEPHSYFARLSDGKSAASRDASVRLDLSGLDITATDGTPPQRWPYVSLSSGEPIRRHSVDVLLSSSQAPGVSLFVPSPGFVAALAARAPQLTRRAERWRHARPWLIGAVAVLALGILINAADLAPTRTIANMLPESWRARLGDAAIASMVENRKRCSAPQGLAALDKLTSRLTAAAGTGQTFKVVVIDWDLFNAFAVPGDKIVLTKGLIAQAGGGDEVAGVLAHEMGHGIALHPETGIIRAIGLSAALELMMGGSGGTMANMGLLLAQLGYTRAAEREADEHALAVLRKAEISQAGLADFFRRVLKEEGAYANEAPGGAKTETEKKKDGFKRALDMFSTHPPTAERADMIRMSPGYPATPALAPGEWAALQSICSQTSPMNEGDTEAATSL